MSTDVTEPTPDKRTSMALPVVVFVLLIVAVEWALGWRQVLAAWATLPAQSLALGIAAVLTSYLLRAYRLFDFFRAEMRGAFLRCTTLSLLHNMLNNLLPMRTGEASLPWLLKRDFSIDYARGIATLVYFRLLDLAALLCIAGGALALILFDGIEAVTLVLLLFALPVIAFPWLRPAAEFSLQRLPAKLSRRLADAVAVIPGDRLPFSRCWWLTVFNWVAKLGAFAWLLAQFAHIALPGGLAGAIGGELSSILPVHGIAGAGTYEAGILAGLLLVDIDTGNKLASAINLHLFVLGAAMLAGLFAMFLRMVNRDS